MFPDNISWNIDILEVINVWKNNFGFHSNQKTQGQKHRVNNTNFKYQVCQMKLRHLNTFLQFSLLFHEPHCICTENLGRRLLWLHSSSQIPIPCGAACIHFLACHINHVPTLTNSYWQLLACGPNSSFVIWLRLFFFFRFARTCAKWLFGWTQRWPTLASTRKSSMPSIAGTFP